MREADDEQRRPFSSRRQHYGPPGEGGYHQQDDGPSAQTPNNHCQQQCHYGPSGQAGNGGGRGYHHRRNSNSGSHHQGQGWRGRGRGGSMGGRGAGGRGAGGGADPRMSRGGNPHGVCLCTSTSCRRGELAGGQVNGHTLRLTEVRPGLTLLGNTAQFCHAYWHMAETPEAPWIRTPMCLRSCCAGPETDQCAGKGVVLVARLLGACSPSEDETIYVARYSNCPDNEHAETFMLRDPKLRDSLRVARGGKLLLYLNKQPCHHSSDYMRGMSCTADLLAFADQELQPLDIRLEVVITYTYRAHWELENLNAKQRQRYGPAIITAREGIHNFCEKRDSGVVLRAVEAQDWYWLVGLCDSDLQRDYMAVAGGSPDATSTAHHASPGSIFSPEQIKARAAMDTFVQDVLIRWGCSASAANRPDGNNKE